MPGITRTPITFIGTVMCFVTPWIVRSPSTESLGPSGGYTGAATGKRGEFLDVEEISNIRPESRLNGGAGCRAQGRRVFWLADRCGGAELLFLVLEGGTDEGGKERMRLEWLGLEFRVELAA